MKYLLVKPKCSDFYWVIVVDDFLDDDTEYKVLILKYHNGQPEKIETQIFGCFIKDNLRRRSIDYAEKFDTLDDALLYYYMGSI